METPKVISTEIEDVILQYLLYDGDGPDLIFLHATGFNPWLWHPIARKLSGRYRIVAPFFCDHRDTDPYRGGLGWNVLTQDLAGLCRYLKIKKPYMIGHSMGGAVCVLAHGLIPDLAEKMILIEPILLPEQRYIQPLALDEHPLDEHPLAGKAIRRKNAWRDPEHAQIYFRSKALFRNWDREMLELYVKYGLSSNPDGTLKLACSPRGEAAIFMGGTAENPWPLLPKIACPVLVLEGENSESPAIMNFKKVATALPRGEHRIIPGAGHLIPMEKPQRTLEIIEDFFGIQ